MKLNELTYSENYRIMSEVKYNVNINIKNIYKDESCEWNNIRHFKVYIVLIFESYEYNSLFTN